jgi:hypothetical protein
MCTKFWLENLKGRDILGALDIGLVTALKLNFKELCALGNGLD